MLPNPLIATEHVQVVVMDPCFETKCGFDLTRIPAVNIPRIYRREKV